MKLREYQENFYQSIRKQLAADVKVIACAATGSGKTKVFLSISTAAISAGKTVLLISEAKKIFNQINQEHKCVEIKAGSKDMFIRKNAIYLAMAQTLARRDALIQSFNALGKDLIVIIDEAHIGTPTKLLAQLTDNYFIGFTATPDFRFAKHLPLLYKSLIVGPQPDELVQMGFLASYRHFQRKAADLKELKIKNGEFTEESQERVFESRAVYDGLLEDLRKVPYKKCMIFTASIKHCIAVSGKLTENGFVCAQVHSKLSKATESYNLSQFTDGPINICVSVGVLTKGFDFPEIDLVVLQRATTSLPLYLQMIGRGSRICEGKKIFTVLDYGLNADRHLPWDYERDWVKMWNKPLKKRSAGTAPIKTCPKCEYIMATVKNVCPNCGHVFQKQEKPHVETELVEVTEMYRKLIGKSISELTAQELATYAKAKNKKGFATVIARAKGIDFLNEFGRELGYKNGWGYIQSHVSNRKELTELDFKLK